MDAILLNLARRALMAQRLARRAVKKGFPLATCRYLEGAENEAWNSLQAAKAIANGKVV